MRKWFASLAVLGLSAVATAQTIPVPPVGGLGQSQSLVFDDGSSFASWKVSYPTGAGDAFSVDIDELATGMTVTGVGVHTYQSTSSGIQGMKFVAMAPDNIIDSLGHTPDLNAAVSMLGSLNGTVVITGNPNATAGWCPGITGYDLPDVVLGSGGYHAVTSVLTGDTGTWLCSDSSAPIDNRSYFTVNNYSSVGIALGGYDLMIRVIGQIATTPGSGPSAYMTVNNATGTTDVTQTGFLSATLWSACAIQPTLYIQGVQIPSYPFLQVPALILATGYENGSPIADSKQGTIGGFLSDPSTGPCIPAGVQFDVYGFYLDNCDLKKNGKPKLKQTNAVTVNVTPDPGGCNPCFCFGQLDDGGLDGFIWKVQNPASSGDYFAVNHGGSDGNGNSCIGNSVTSFQIPSWDFCGTGSTTGPSWASIGLYEGSTVDPAGTPDLSAVIASATTLSMPVNSTGFGYPATTYDFPDVFVSTSSALANMTNGHMAAKWPTGDTCIWLAGDSDGADDGALPTASCSTFPSTNSYFTANGYSTNGIQFTSTNFMMKVDFN
jgi:hypothetical protein